MTVFVSLFCIMISASALIVSAYRDIQEYRIPNRASIVIAVSFLIYAIFNLSLMAFAFHLAIAFTVFSLAFLLYLRNAFGAGDVKLLAAISLWAGSLMIMPLVFVIALFGGVFASIIIMSQKIDLHTQKNKKIKNPFFTWLKDRKEIPYGVAIAFGGLLVLHDSMKIYL